MFFYDEGSNQVKIVTHATFDRILNYLPIDALPPMCQQFQHLNNNQRPPPDATELNHINVNFFVYPFAIKKVATILGLPNNKNPTFGFDLKNNKLYGHTCIWDVEDIISSSDTNSFGTYKHSCNKLCGVYNTYINNDPVFSTAHAVNKLKSLCEHFLKDKD